jgi:hypothetical protein
MGEDSGVEKPRESASDCLIRAIERAEDFDDVVVLYSRKDGKIGCMENDVTISDAIFIMEMCKHYLLDRATKD